MTLRRRIKTPITWSATAPRLFHVLQTENAISYDLAKVCSPVFTLHVDSHECASQMKAKQEDMWCQWIHQLAEQSSNCFQSHSVLPVTFPVLLQSTEPTKCNCVHNLLVVIVRQQTKLGLRSNIKKKFHGLSQRAIQTEWPPLVGEVSASFCG
jgi:hypothetical protein